MRNKIPLPMVVIGRRNEWRRNPTLLARKIPRDRIPGTRTTESEQEAREERPERDRHRYCRRCRVTMVLRGNPETDPAPRGSAGTGINREPGSASGGP